MDMEQKQANEKENMSLHKSLVFLEDMQMVSILSKHNTLPYTWGKG